jgi:hypothetical protein
VTLLALALAGFVGLVLVGRVSRLKGEWRPAAAVVALAAFAGAGVAGIRQEWLLCAGLLAAGAAFATSARRR